jgi:transcriptional regulator with XRE-family HTH domain
MSHGVLMGDRIRRARARAGWSQQQLADAIGKSRLTIHNYESGKSAPGPVERAAIAEALHVPLDFIERGVEDGSTITDPTVGPEAGDTMNVPRTLPHRVRVWVYKFLLQLVEGGASDEEVREARALLTAPAITGYLADGAPRAAQLTEAEIIESLEAIGEHVIRRVLRKHGRDV